MPPERFGTSSRRGVPPFAASLCLAALLFLVWQLVDGLGFISFADEATHVVAGRVLDRGGILYRDFIDSHGPLIFAMAQGYGAVFGWTDSNGVRGLIAACALLAILSLAAAPAAASRTARLWGLAAGSTLLASVWLRQGLFLFSFYPVGSALASIALSGFVAGACFNRFPRPPHAFAAGLAAALLLGTAYSFLPTLLAFGAAGFGAARRAHVRPSLVGFGGGLVAGALLMGAYMLRFADLHGYLSYHLAENQLVYARHIDFGWQTFLRGLLPGTAPAARAQTLGVACLFSSLLGLALPGVRRGPFALAWIGVLLLNARGASSFQNGSFLWASITLLACVVMRAASTGLPMRRPFVPIGVVLVALALVFMRGALMLPFGLPAQVVDTLPRWRIGDRSEGAFFASIRRYARADEPILGLAYQPQLYLLADRLPMPGFYAWFPWDQDYVGMGRFGRGRDLCRALADEPPPVIVVDPSPFWGRTPDSILPCLPAILAARYRADDRNADIHGQLFIRQDRLDAPDGLPR